MLNKDKNISRIHARVSERDFCECQNKDEIVKKAKKAWSNLFQEFVSKCPDEGQAEADFLFYSFMGMINRVSMAEGISVYRLKRTAKSRLKQFIRMFDDKIDLLEKLKKDTHLCSHLDIEEKNIDSKIMFYKDLKTSLLAGRINKHSLIKEGSKLFVITLHLSGFGQSQIINIIFNIFVAFKYQDFGKGDEGYIKKEGDMTLSEVRKKDNIRKIFVESVIQYPFGK